MPEKFVCLSSAGLPLAGVVGSASQNAQVDAGFAAVAAAAAATFHGHLAPGVDQRTPHDGRISGGGFYWDSPAAAVAAARMHAYHHPAHGITGGTPSPSSSLTAAAELQFAAAAAAAQRRSATATEAAAAAAAAAAYRISPYVDHLYGYPTTSLRGLSPVDTRGIAVAAAAMHPDYMQQMPGAAAAAAAAAGLGHRSVMSDFHGSVAPSTIASTDLPFSLESSRLTTPRPGVRQGRKRALSSSPYSDSFDINSMIRFSPNSLVTIMNGSRSGSSTSGSYGHLSAGTISPALGVHPSAATVPQLHQLQQLMRQGSLAPPSGSPFIPPPHHHHHHHHPGSLMPQSAGLTASQQSLLFAQHQSQVDQMLGKEQMNSIFHQHHHAQHGVPNGSMLPHPHMIGSGLVDHRKLRTTMVKKESHIADKGKDPSGNSVNNHGSDPMKDEPGDFVETNCHWKDCEKEFTTQEELVKHINNEHIQTNKKSFICRWRECSREEKPFKAQYMLVVHMRRHTGEKPHRCTFEGCSKAYSRLENLKTHLRSHTGEKPYTCEFPGCTKAFSNASDRAKHQNRTHSNEKPYVCKAPGCTKRYTDPSSLRKHVKTVHGAEFYANKKHKGIDHCNNGSNHNNSDNNKDGENCANDSSPRSDDGSAQKTTGSLSSPSIKSEDTNSPPQNHHSPSGGDSNMVNGFSLGGHNYLENPISDSNISTSNGVDIIEESEWELAEADELDIPEAAMAAAVIGGSLTSSSVNFVSDRNNRNRIKNNLSNKSRLSSVLPPIHPFSGPGTRRSGNHGSGNNNNPQTDIKPIHGGQSQRKHIDPNFNPSSRQTNNLAVNRRDSTSTISSFYCSMRSDASPHPFGSQMSSRRESEVSQASASRFSNLNSPYDPISPGSSRKSSNISNFQGISATMTAHLQRLHRKAIEHQQEANTANLVVQTQNMSIDSAKNTNRLPKIAGSVGRQTSMSCKTPQPRAVSPKDTRRASDPVRPLDRNFGINQRLNRHNSHNNFGRSNLLPPISKSPAGKVESRNVHHPNGDILLEELDENEPIETNQNMIIPDDMMNYLNQVAENGDSNDDVYRPESEMSLNFSSVSQYANMRPKPQNSQPQNFQSSHMLSPTYTTLQPVRTSRLSSQQITNGGQQNVVQQYGMVQPMNAMQGNLQMSQNCAPQIQQNVSPFNPCNGVPQNSNVCYGHQQQYNSNQVQCQNGNQYCTNVAGNGYQNPMANANCNYNQQQVSPHVCANQNVQQMNQGNNGNMGYNSMCNNCNTGSQNTYTNLIPVKQSPNGSQNITANYCMTQHQTNQFSGQGSPGAGVTNLQNFAPPQIQETVTPNHKSCQNCVSQNPVEIQCNDISQSCRPTNKLTSQRTDSYQRTLQYVQQCQQLSDQVTRTVPLLEPIKKPLRRVSVSTEMSPGCKEVTSTTDGNLIPELQTLGNPAIPVANPPLLLSPAGILNLPEAPPSETHCTDRGSCLNTPCMESIKSAAQTPLIPENNMVINDMSSSLATFSEETKFLQLIQ